MMVSVDSSCRLAIMVLHGPKASIPALVPLIRGSTQHSYNCLVKPIVQEQKREVATSLRQVLGGTSYHANIYTRPHGHNIAVDSVKIRISGILWGHVQIQLVVIRSSTLSVMITPDV